jgi:threonine dehydrogenase-like Zn-dependent dehydrogenase
VRAIVFSRPGEFSLTEVPDPVPGPRDAIVRVEAVGICGNDLLLHSYARPVEMFAAGALNAKPMVSHAFALADYGEALKAFRAGTGRKIQVRPQARESVELL